MNLFWVFLWFVIHCLTYALQKYCNDGPHFSRGQVSGLRMPSIYDLEESTDRYTTDKYVKKVICPSHNYFILEKKLLPDSDSGFLAQLILQSGSFICILRSLFNYLNAQGVYNNNKIVWIIFTIVVPLVACILFRYGIHLLYKATLSVPEYSYSQDWLHEHFQHLDRDFPVSEARAFQNFVINEYYDYLLMIESTMSKRKVLSGFINTVATIIYVLFFFRVES